MIEFKAVKAKHILEAQKVGQNDLEAVLKLYGSLIKSWDFVDEDGKDLPLPSNNPEIMLELTMPQVAEITTELSKLTNIPKQNSDNS